MRLAVIGAGPGGYVAAIRAAQLGAEVTLIEQNAVGGTCLNAGCIPTKSLLHATESAGRCTAAKTVTGSAEWEQIQRHKKLTVEKMSGGVAALLKTNKVTLLRATARFSGPDTLQVTAPDGGVETVHFDRAILSSGSEPVLIPVPGAVSDRVITSECALSFPMLPESLAVIGGGVVGVELATVFARLGVPVRIVEACERILPNMDAELCAFAAKRLRKLGVEIHTACPVLRIDPAREGAEVVFSDGEKEGRAAGELVLMSTGRKPRTAQLSLETAGVCTVKGAVSVDASMRTSAPHIYAVGDCTGGMMLAHVASMQGELAAENAVLGTCRAFDSKTVPSCVYTEPELASVGLTEEQAARRGEVLVGRFHLAANAKTALTGGEGFFKLVADAGSGEILGVHLCGPHATELIAQGALALRMRATLDDLIETVHAHPTVGEAIREAALAAKGRAIHAPNRPARPQR